MRHEINTEINIQGRKEDLWNVLMDFHNHNQWNPFIEKIKGDPQVGNKIFVRLGGMSFRPIVKVNNKYQEFSWLGRLLLPGIFSGNHIFVLKEKSDGTVDFIQNEKFFGVLVPFMKKKLDATTKPSFEAMNRALKVKVEGISKN